MSLPPQDNARASFAQTQPRGGQHMFNGQPNISNSSSTQQRAYPVNRQTQGIRPQQAVHNSPYTTPYTQTNVQLQQVQQAQRPNGNVGVSAEQQIAQGVLNGNPMGSGNNTPQRRPPPLGKTIHMTPHGTPQTQPMNINHAINPATAMSQAQSAINQAQRQAQNGSPAMQTLAAQRQVMNPSPSNSNLVVASPDTSQQDLSMIDPQLGVEGQLIQHTPSMLAPQPEGEVPQVLQGDMLSAPPGGSFPTFEALFAFAQAHALAHGYAFVIGRSKRDNRGLKKVFLICDRGGTNKEKVPGEQRQRKTKSRKCGCEFGVFGLENKTTWLLRGRHDGEHLTHNHPPSDSPTEHPGARKLDPKAIAAVKALEENGVSVKETLEILHRENPTVRYLPRDIYNARAAIKRDPSRVEATAMEQLPTFYKKPPMTFEEKLRAELRTEVANAQAEVEKVKEAWRKEVEELKEQLRSKDKMIQKFEMFIDLCNERVMVQRERLETEAGNTSG